MVTLPKDRIELVLMADQAEPIHLWLQSNGELARRLEYDKERSVRILGGAALLFMLFFFSAATAILLLMGVVVLFPLTLVGMAGYFRGR